MQSPPFNLTAALATFGKTLELFIAEHHSSQVWDYRWSLAIAVGALLASLAVIVAGIQNRGKTAALIGVLVTGLVALDRQLALGEKAQFWQVISTEGENIRDDLQFVQSVDDFKKVVDRLKILRAKSAQDNPKGQGMQSVIDLQRQLAAIRAPEIKLDAKSADYLRGIMALQDWNVNPPKAPPGIKVPGSKLPS